MIYQSHLQWRWVLLLSDDERPELNQLEEHVLASIYSDYTLCFVNIFFLLHLFMQGESRGRQYISIKVW